MFWPNTWLLLLLLLLCIIRICILRPTHEAPTREYTHKHKQTHSAARQSTVRTISCINTDNTWASTSMYLRDTWGQWLPLPRRRSRLPRSCRPCSRPRCWRPRSGSAGRAAGRPIRGSAAGQQAGRSVMFCPRCWRVVGVHTVHSARRWCCIISIQISALVLCIIRIFIYYL